MLNQYFNSSKLVFFIRGRSINEKMKKYPFLFAGIFCLSLIFLYSVGSIIKLTLYPLINYYVQESMIVELYKSLFFSASIIPMALYIFLFVITPYGKSKTDEFLENLQISRKVINLINSSFSIFIISFFSFFLLSIFIVPSLSGTGLTKFNILCLMMMLFIQILLSIVLTVSISSFIVQILSYYKVPFSKTISNLSLILLGVFLVYIFFEKEISTLRVDYSPWAAVSNILIYLQIGMRNIDNIKIIPSIVYISIGVIIYIVHIMTYNNNNTENESIIILNNKLTKLEPIFSVTLKEVIRDKDVISNYCTIVLITIIVSVMNRSLLDNEFLCTLLVSSCFIFSLNGFSYHKVYLPHYKANKIKPVRIFFSKIMVIWLVSLSLLLILSIFEINLLNTFIKTMFVQIIIIHFFFLIGLLVPFNKDNSKNSFLVILSIAIILIPLSYILQNLIIQYNVRKQTLYLIGLIVLTILIVITFLLIKEKTKKGGIKA